MKNLGYILLFLAGVSQLNANPVAPKSTLGFNTGWVILAGLTLEYVVANLMLRQHLADRKEFIVRFLGVHIATLPICYIVSAMGYVTPWILAQIVVVFIEAWFYSKAPGHPKWKIALMASAAANVSSAVFAIVTHRL